MDPIKNDNYPREAGIYKLTSKLSNKIYIGKAINLYKRLREHKNSETQKSNNKFYIRNSIQKYGWDSFDVEILEIIEGFDKTKDNNELLVRESYYIDLFDSTNLEIGYNICKSSNDRTGLKHSEETKLKMSLASKGKPKSKEAVEKMRQSKLGKPRKPHSKETIEKTNQTKRLNKLLGKPRKPFSEESRKKMSEAQKGRKMSEEARQKMSDSSKGKPKSKGHVEKMRQVNLGKKHSEETKEKMRQAHQRNKIND